MCKIIKLKTKKQLEKEWIELIDNQDTQGILNMINNNNFNIDMKIDVADGNDWTGLMYACYNGLNKAATVLIENNADVNYECPDTRTPLFVALECKNINKSMSYVIKLLLINGASQDKVKEIMATFAKKKYNANNEFIEKISLLSKSFFNKDINEISEENRNKLFHKISMTINISKDELIEIYNNKYNNKNMNKKYKTKIYKFNNKNTNDEVNDTNMLKNLVKKLFGRSLYEDNE